MRVSALVAFCIRRMLISPRFTCTIFASTFSLSLFFFFYLFSPIGLKGQRITCTGRYVEVSRGRMRFHRTSSAWLGLGRAPHKTCTVYDKRESLLKHFLSRSSSPLCLPARALMHVLRGFVDTPVGWTRCVPNQRQNCGSQGSTMAIAIGPPSHRRLIGPRSLLLCVCLAASGQSL
ncbi:hypothetical protein GGI43DRAFT_31256 [Trichoderma evansii]